MSDPTKSESSEDLLSAEEIPGIHRYSSSNKVWLTIISINILLLLAISITALSNSQELSERKLAILQDLNVSRLVASASAPDHQQVPPGKPAAPSGWLTCGNTFSGAIGNGCIFDLMLSTWLHPECYRKDHSSATLRTANVSFFLDEESTIPFAGARSGDWPLHYIWTEPRFHALHYAYMWERQMQARVSGGLVDTQSWNLKHTGHCVMTVLERNSPYLYESARLRRGFSDCGRP